MYIYIYIIHSSNGHIMSWAGLLQEFSTNTKGLHHNGRRRSSGGTAP
jgi:hypothetical protein